MFELIVEDKVAFHFKLNTETKILNIYKLNFYYKNKTFLELKRNIYKFYSLKPHSVEHNYTCL